MHNTKTLLTAKFAALLAMFLAFGVLMGGIAVAAPSPSSAVTPAKVATDIAGFRAINGNLMNSYLATYGSRFTAQERSAFTQAKAQADQSLLSLQRATSVIDRLSTSGASKSRLSKASLAAQRSYAKAYAEAETTQQTLEPILRNRLSLFEALNAYRDYSQAMSDFTAIGDSINEIADRYTQPSNGRKASRV
jgi:hypothetical protein